MALDTGQLSQLEDLCEAFYGGDLNQQKQAHEVLLPLVCNLNCLTQLQSLLAQSSKPHALMFACNGLSKLFTNNWPQIPDNQKEETKTFLLNYLYKCGPDMLRTAPYLVGHFVRLLCQIVKYGWLDTLSSRNQITDQVSQFLTATIPHWIIGLIIFTTLTQEMQLSSGLYFAKYRRAALLFRDTSLPVIFDIGIKTLRQIHLGSIKVTDIQEEYKLLKQVLQLINNCLSFDFMGTIPDETSEDQNTIMIPHTWTSLREEYIPTIFFDIYTKCCQTYGDNMSECACLCLQCLILISSIRRSFFPTQNDRIRCLSSLIVGTGGIIQTSLGLENENCYHELCRLLGKLNTANQLTELSSTESFSIWIEQLYNFTIKSLQEWSILPNSKHYLLNLWSHMVIPILYQGDRAPVNLENYINNITKTFIESRMKLAEAIANGNDIDDPLDSEVMRTEQLDVLSQLSRCRYHDIAEFAVNLFEKITNDVKTGHITQNCFLHQITWCIYIHGALIGGHSIKIRRPLAPNIKVASDNDNSNMSNQNQISHHVLNGKLAQLVFALSQQTDTLNDTSESLELAYLYFLEQFRRICLGDYAKQFVQPEFEEATLASILGVDSEDDVLSLIIGKIGRNLQTKYKIESIINKTLNLFHELAAGISIVQYTDRTTHLIVSGRLLLKNEQVQSIMKNHSSPEFVFLNVPRYGKYRTSYYFTLSKLLFLEIKDDENSSNMHLTFDEFMKPQEKVLDLLWENIVLKNNLNYNLNNDVSSIGYHKEQFKQTLIGLTRDLRGICQACVGPESYNSLFNWLVNKPKQIGQSRIHLFTWVANQFWDDSDVMIPLLKFISEFVDNKSQRISFDRTSPNGILLFKEVSSLICTYTPRILSKTVTSFQNIYKEKYKGLAITLEMLCNALSGGYTNFGIFEVYQDQALDNCLRIACQTCLVIPESDLQSYLKNLKAYYEFLELATRNFISIFILSMDSQNLASICYSLESGLCSVDNVVLLACCTTLDHFVTYIFKIIEKENIVYPGSKSTNFNETEMDGGDNRLSDEGKVIKRFMTEQSNSLVRIMQLMFNLITTGDLSTWTFARSLLGMILLFEKDFYIIQQQLVNQQIGEKREKYQSLFNDLLKGTDGTLSTISKDAFTRNLHYFAHMIRSNTV